MRYQELIEALNLRPLNLESGRFDVVYISEREVVATDGPSRASNCIYYMLTPELRQNYLHWVWSDDYQILIEGGPADFFLFYADGRVEKITMGRDLAAGEQLIVPCPGGTYKAILLHEHADYLLTGSVVTPAWNPQRARVGADDAFIEQYAGQAPWATPKFLRQLIGPNFRRAAGADGQPLALRIDADGQILWQGMQLTSTQFATELQIFAANEPGQPLRVEVDVDAPSTAIVAVQTLAQQAGVTIAR